MFAGCRTHDVLKRSLVLTPPSMEQDDVEGDVALNRGSQAEASVSVDSHMAHPLISDLIEFWEDTQLGA